MLYPFSPLSVTLDGALFDTDVAVHDMNVLNFGRAETHFVIPQREYAASSRRLSNVHAPIEFYSNGKKGVRIADILLNRGRGIDNGEDRLFGSFGTKVSYRIEWGGYPSFARQRYARRATRNRQSITRRQIAMQVADVVRAFIEANSSWAVPDGALRVGPGGIQLSDLVLLEIHQVSKASWQPCLALVTSAVPFS